ncbi:MAG: hypothetical protein AAFX08_02265 [Pseudomonadota bacterium]
MAFRSGDADDAIDIVTVHGTFAQDDADAGENWWQRGSPFWTVVQRQLDTQLNIEPFHWSGRNSEVDRRAAGARLFRSLRKRRTPPLIVGHSHGGSVGAQALLLRYLTGRRADFDLVRGFISIGMPLILFRSNRNPITILDLRGRIAMTVIMGVLAVLLYSLLNAEAASLSGFIGDNSLTLSAALIGVSVLFFFVRRNFRRQRAFRRNVLHDKARDLYLRMSHSQDEAINALRQGVGLAPKIVRFRQVFIGVFSLLAFLFVANVYVEAIGNQIAEDELRLSDRSEGLAVVENPVWLSDEDAADVDRHFRSVGAFRFAGAEAISPMAAFFSREFRLRADLSLVTLEDFRGELDRLSDDDIDARLNGENLMGGATDYVVLREVKGMSIEDVREMTIEFFAAAARDSRYYVRERDRSRFVTWFAQEASHSEIVSTTPEDEARVDTRMGPAAYLRVFGDPLVSTSNDGQTERVIEKGAELVTSIANRTNLARACGDLVEEFADGWIEGSRRTRSAYRWCDLIEPVPRPLDFLMDAHSRVTSAILDGTASAVATASGFDGYCGGPDYLCLPEAVRPDTTTSVTFQIANLIPVLGFSAIIAAIAGVLGAPVLNAYLNGVLRAQAYGNDGYGERVVGVSPSIDVDEETVGALPQSVEAEMVALSHNDAPGAIDRLRDLLASGALTTGEAGHDPLAVAMKFDGAELLHNGYFVSPLFAKLFAIELIERFGARPSEAYRTDPDVADLLRERALV